MGETCPQYLFFSIDDFRKPDGARWICSPPMRTAADNERLWQGLADGTIQTIGTDHCPFFYDGTRRSSMRAKRWRFPAKRLGAGDFTKIPNGLPGVGDRFADHLDLWVGSGRLTPQQFVALTATKPGAYLLGVSTARAPSCRAQTPTWLSGTRAQLKYGVNVLSIVPITTCTRLGVDRVSTAGLFARSSHRG
jgi:dihydropyrimidinase